MMNQQRFAEAEVIGKQAKELAPDNPLAEVMVMKAKFARRLDAERKQQKVGDAEIPNGDESTNLSRMAVRGITCRRDRSSCDKHEPITLASASFWESCGKQRATSPKSNRASLYSCWRLYA